MCYNKNVRVLAQPGSALALGARGRRFESCMPDHARLAQMVERHPYKVDVGGSIPSLRTNAAVAQ